MRDPKHPIKTPGNTGAEYSPCWQAVVLVPYWYPFEFMTIKSGQQSPGQTMFHRYGHSRVTFRHKVHCDLLQCLAFSQLMMLMGAGSTGRMVISHCWSRFITWYFLLSRSCHYSSPPNFVDVKRSRLANSRKVFRRISCQTSQPYITIPYP